MKLYMVPVCVLVSWALSCSGSVEPAPDDTDVEVGASVGGDAELDRQPDTQPDGLPLDSSVESDGPIDFGPELHADAIDATDLIEDATDSGLPETPIDNHDGSDESWSDDIEATDVADGSSDLSDDDSQTTDPAPAEVSPDTDASSSTGAVTVNVARTGSVVSDPTGIECLSPAFDGDVECTYDFDVDTVVLNASPNASYGFAQTHWSGDCATSEGDSCTVALDGSAQEVFACFFDGSGPGLSICQSWCWDC